MKLKKFLAAAAATMALSVMAAGSAFASEAISDVYISIAIDEDEDLYAGDVYSGMEPDVDDDDMYYVDEYELSNDDPSPKKSYTYTMYVIPQDGYYFTDSTAVHVYGAYEVSISSRKSDELKIKAKAYPFAVLDNPTNIIIDEDEKKASWDAVDHAKSYNVVIYYTTSNDNDRETKKNVSHNYIDLKGYIGKYDDVSVSVQAVKGSTQGDKYIANSDYVRDDGTIDDDYSPDEFVFNIPTAHSNGSTTTDGSSSSNSTSTIGPSGSSTDGWSGSGDTWYYYSNGNKVTGWVGDGDNWYFCDSNGLMQAGWYSDGWNWYYLNTEHDGYYGKMLAGYQVIDGVTYYFNEIHDGTYGAMYTDRVTPDGRYAGTWGAVE